MTLGVRLMNTPSIKSGTVGCPYRAAPEGCRNLKQRSGGSGARDRRWSDRSHNSLHANRRPDFEPQCLKICGTGGRSCRLPPASSTTSKVISLRKIPDLSRLCRQRHFNEVLTTPRVLELILELLPNNPGHSGRAKS